MVDQRGCAESLTGLFVSLALVLIALSLLLVLVALFAMAALAFLILRHFIRHTVMPQLYPATAVFAEMRLFGAPPDSQLFSAFDYWLSLLEQTTGVTFTDSPSRMLIGSLIISLSPALSIGLPLSLLTGTDAWLQVLGVGGVIVGTVVGRRLGQPAEGWFSAMVGPGSGRVSEKSEGGFRLGEDEW